jgi:hypothetical protein
MTPEDASPTPYIVYLVRCWPVKTDRGVVWRASAEEPHTHTRHLFADLPALYRFLNARTAAALRVPQPTPVHHGPKGE